MKLVLKPNPGGKLDPKDVIGRDELIKKLWRILRRQSLVLTSERRIGKTTILTKMLVEAPSGMNCMFCDLEQVHTAAEFADLIFTKVEKRLGGKKRFTERGRRLLQQVRGASVEGTGVELEIASTPWKSLLSMVMEELGSCADKPIIFFWDELPLMIESIADREGDDQAMEVLDTLRAMRQTCPGLRMVYTGSIGLHLVISRLKRAGYANEPVNDMYPEEVKPLDKESAQTLARGLVAGTKAATKHPYAVAEVMAMELNGLPFLMHYTAAEMEGMESVDEASAKEIIRIALTTAEDPWDLHHYEKRVETYYQEKDQPMVLALLDIFAAHERPLKFDEVFDLVKARIQTEDVEHVREVLMLLRQDHYVVQEQDGTYRFRFGIIQRWWRLHRGLEVIG